MLAAHMGVDFHPCRKLISTNGHFEFTRDRKTEWSESRKFLRVA